MCEIPRSRKSVCETGRHPTQRRWRQVNQPQKHPGTHPTGHVPAPETHTRKPSGPDHLAHLAAGEYPTGNSPQPTIFWASQTLLGASPPRSSRPRGQTRLDVFKGTWATDRLLQTGCFPLAHAIVSCAWEPGESGHPPRRQDGAISKNCRRHRD